MILDYSVRREIECKMGTICLRIAQCKYPKGVSLNSPPRYSGAGSQRSATPGVPIKLCKDNAIEVESFIEFPCRINGILTGH